MEEKLYFKSSGLKLCGILTKAEKETRKCIVLCHGISVDKEEGGVFTELANKLAEAGFSVFRFDFRGSGESEGKSTEITIEGEKNDVGEAITFLQSLGYNEFGIVSASFSGGPVVYYALEHQDIVKALVLWNSILDYTCLLEPKLPWPKKYFAKEFIEKAKEKGYLEVGSSGFKIGIELIEEMKTLYPWRKMNNLKVPMLFIHGDKDAYVPYEDSVQFSKLLRAKLETIEGANHGFHYKKEYAEQADKATIKFFLRNM